MTATPRIIRLLAVRRLFTPCLHLSALVGRHPRSLRLVSLRARAAAAAAACAVIVLLSASLTGVQQSAPGTGPAIVLETSKGAIEFETYPEEAPKTVARIVELVKRGFYNGQRFHRVVPNLLVQIGDPTSRDMSRQEWWGRAGSGKPLGAAEMTKKRRHLRGAVAMAYPAGDPKSADSQFYIVLRAAPEWDGKYAVFGRVTKGMDVVARIQRADVLKRASVKDGTGGS